MSIRAIGLVVLVLGLAGLVLFAGLATTMPERDYPDWEYSFWDGIHIGLILLLPIIAVFFVIVGGTMAIVGDGPAAKDDES